MVEKLKASRYNHFVEEEDGKWLAFNALSCGLGELDSEKYQRYLKLAGGDGHPEDPAIGDLLKDLKMGGFLIPEDVDELDAIRAGHYRARFGNNGFGLTLIPTVNCNFACDYCYESREMHSRPPKDGSVMSDEVCDNIVKLCEERIPEKSAFTVTWYGGEPLLATHIIDRLTKEFVRICEAKKSKYYAGIITNGYLLTQENLEFLIRSHVTFAQVTIDGPEEVHDRRRCLKSGGPTYRRIMENLGNLIDEKGFQVSLRINVDNRNRNDMHELLVDFKASGFHRFPNLSFYFSQVNQYDSICSAVSNQCMIDTQFAEFITGAYNDAIEMGFRVAIFPQRIISSCGAVTTNSALIEPDGTIQNCWNTVGNISARTGTLSPVGIKYSDSYLKWLGWTPFKIPCVNCEIMPICMGGCPYKGIHKLDNKIMDESPCIYFKYNLKLILTIAKKAKDQGLLLLSNRLN